MKIQTRIPKLVIKPDEIDDNNHWALNLNENTTTCNDCGSHLFYIKEELGVVAEENDYMVINNRSEKTYDVRVIGLTLYCAECGAVGELYYNFCYDEDKVVCSWDELGGSEKIEIGYCLNQWNQKGDFKPQWKCGEVVYLKEKLKEYEKKHPLKLDKPRKVKKKSVKKRGRTSSSRIRINKK